MVFAEPCPEVLKHYLRYDGVSQVNVFQDEPGGLYARLPVAHAGRYQECIALKFQPAQLRAAKVF